MWDDVNWVAVFTLLLGAGLLTYLGSVQGRRAEARHRLADQKADYIGQVFKNVNLGKKARSLEPQIRELQAKLQESVTSGSVSDGTKFELAMLQRLSDEFSEGLEPEHAMLDDLYFRFRLYLSHHLFRLVLDWKFERNGVNEVAVAMAAVKEIKATRAGGVRYWSWLCGQLYWAVRDWRIMRKPPGSLDGGLPKA